MGEPRDWIPTPKAKDCARALGIDIDEWPDWLARTYRRNSLREIKALLLGYRIQVSYQWLSDQLQLFGIPTYQRKHVKEPQEATG